MLRVSYFDSAVSVVCRVLCVILRASSVVNFLACVCSRGHIFSLIVTKLDQNVCLDEILDEIKNGSCQVKN